MSEGKLLKRASKRALSSHVANRYPILVKHCGKIVGICIIEL